MSTQPATTRANKELRAEEAEWCLAQRLASRSYEQIATASLAEFGRHIPRATAYKRVKWALDRRMAEPTEAVRALELGKLDELDQIVRGVIDAHDAGAAVRLTASDRLLKIQERRAKLLGIDAPERVAATTTVRYEVVGVDIASLT